MPLTEKDRAAALRAVQNEAESWLQALGPKDFESTHGLTEEQADYAYDMMIEVMHRAGLLR